MFENSDNLIIERTRLILLISALTFSSAHFKKILTQMWDKSFLHQSQNISDFYHFGKTLDLFRGGTLFFSTVFLRPLHDRGCRKPLYQKHNGAMVSENFLCLILTVHCKKTHFVPNRYIYLKQIILFTVIATIWNERKFCFAITHSFWSK